MNKNVYSDFALEIDALNMKRQFTKDILDSLDFSQLPKELISKITQLSSQGKISIEPNKVLESVLNCAPQGKDQPEIPIKNGKKTITSVPIKENVDIIQLKEQLYALGVLVVIYELNNRLNDVYDKLESILKGLSNDRKAKCLAAIETFNILSTNVGEEEQSNLAKECFLILQEGLAQVHLELEEYKNKICTMPQDDWDTVKQSLRYFGAGKADQNDCIIANFFDTLIFYNRMLSYSNYLILKMPIQDRKAVITKNEQKFKNLLSRIGDDILMKRLEYISEDRDDLKKQLSQEGYIYKLLKQK